MSLKGTSQSFFDSHSLFQLPLKGTCWEGPPVRIALRKRWRLWVLFTSVYLINHQVVHILVNSVVCFLMASYDFLSALSMSGNSSMDVHHFLSSREVVVSVRMRVRREGDLVAVVLVVTCPSYSSGTQIPVSGSGLHHCCFVGWGACFTFSNWALLPGRVSSYSSLSSINLSCCFCTFMVVLSSLTPPSLQKSLIRPTGHQHIWLVWPDSGTNQFLLTINVNQHTTLLLMINSVGICIMWLTLHTPTLGIGEYCIWANLSFIQHRTWPMWLCGWFISMTRIRLVWWK